jgi:putative transcriptional regulator
MTKLMSEKKGNELLASLRQAARYAKTRKLEPGMRRTLVPKPLAPAEVRALRSKLGLTQEGLSAVVGESPKAIQSWEQGLRNPTGAACQLMRLLDECPGLVKTLQHAA